MCVKYLLLWGKGENYKGCEKVLRIPFGPKKDEGYEQFKILQSEELQDLYR
jgi:hypothetical protein